MRLGPVRRLACVAGPAVALAAAAAPTAGAADLWTETGRSTTSVSYWQGITFDAGTGTFYQHATPDRLWRHFLDATGTIHTTDDTLTVDLRLRTYHPVLIDAGLADHTTPIPWLNGRQLRFRFPPR